ncbi:expressed protein [Batrachochytrium dendrobatidis JAM81]|uniref:Expressed protein n=2 Tax=Batrachochytrium dendrobatidis TaxID=109871 RepID=F4P0Q2_BATDJ|nr:uncharacterized protein BATDEDRAFT_33130 [Batrachochytrium dendrobatidis JAM81]EGF81319.1 expressed protein [Batrachochytrium dendrobatidis JAM81]KAJ8329629.1 hypothetical protein O5D80_002196 [Batrachochytrium dendrobatidis]KAK5669524.1 hypothetical protein QVD99_003918 [Batrachochytrium dendrobatidis]OAJ38046.1 hypothetical protein BDEG_22015 [Batrachochytrium dendrobatidis JEL423]|eukprot:XP_006677979.1 expressed protein [Batrachochytrium dendrobatidis JAM81]
MYLVAAVAILSLTGSVIAAPGCTSGDTAAFTQCATGVLTNSEGSGGQADQFSSCLSLATTAIQYYNCLCQKSQGLSDCYSSHCPNDPGHFIQQQFSLQFCGAVKPSEPSATSGASTTAPSGGAASTSGGAASTSGASQETAAPPVAATSGSAASGSATAPGSGASATSASGAAATTSGEAAPGAATSAGASATSASGAAATAGASATVGGTTSHHSMTASFGVQPSSAAAGAAGAAKSSSESYSVKMGLTAALLGVACLAAAL